MKFHHVRNDDIIMGGGESTRTVIGHTRFVVVVVPKTRRRRVPSIFVMVFQFKFNFYGTITIVILVSVVAAVFVSWMMVPPGFFFRVLSVRSCSHTTSATATTTATATATATRTTFIVLLFLLLVTEAGRMAFLRRRRRCVVSIQSHHSFLAKLETALVWELSISLSRPLEDERMVLLAALVVLVAVLVVIEGREWHTLYRMLLRRRLSAGVCSFCGCVFVLDKIEAHAQPMM
jgi:hypothetical protein